ncbi:unnamed protein product [Brassicogethes aeneus]|uniref:Lipase n=1 Tax=Brassicogethes aeneus TaxID=1431903 RepID=A0A9P0ARY5_BRAAE|nr:unnamed protein product [Brassicogethes aeneus]
MEIHIAIIFLIFGLQKLKAEIINYRLPFVKAAALDGYKAETHQVTTDDGYILTMHRIPSAKNSSKINKYPVFMVPGMTAVSDCFILLGNASIAYTLVENGYDVWLTNPRGNKHSQKHVKYNAMEDKEYWNYTIHEMGHYDIASFVDYIRNVTKKDKISGMGHSQGTTLIFLLLSSRPDYNDKLNIFVALAPSVYLNDSLISVMKIVGKYSNFFDHMIREVLNIHFLPRSLFEGMETVCNSGPAFFSLCRALIAGFCDNLDYGVNLDRIYDFKIFNLAFSHMPSELCIKMVMHYFQMIDSGNFCKFDYGQLQNTQMYGSSTPPRYDIKKITIPVGLIFARHDLLIPLSVYYIKHIFAYYVIHHF